MNFFLYLYDKCFWHFVDPQWILKQNTLHCEIIKETLSACVTYSDGVGGRPGGRVSADGEGWWCVYASVSPWPVLPLCHNHPCRKIK